MQTATTNLSLQASTDLCKVKNSFLGLR